MKITKENKLAKLLRRVESVKSEPHKVTIFLNDNSRIEFFTHHFVPLVVIHKTGEETKLS